MRPALYWVIRFGDGSYERPDSLPAACKVETTRRQSSAYRWRIRDLAMGEVISYRAIGYDCRIVRIVRKAT